MEGPASCCVLAAARISELRTGACRLAPERHELFLEQWRREELRRTPFANFADPPSYEEMAARFKVAYRRRPKPIWRSRLELKGHSKERWNGTAKAPA